LSGQKSAEKKTPILRKKKNVKKGHDKNCSFGGADRRRVLFRFGLDFLILEVLERHLRHRALVVCMETGERYMECLYKIVSSSKLELGSQPWAVEFLNDYKEYDKKMREAGMK